jgi:hypothetical protein
MTKAKQQNKAPLQKLSNKIKLHYKREVQLPAPRRGVAFDGVIAALSQRAGLRHAFLGFVAGNV